MLNSKYRKETKLQSRVGEEVQKRYGLDVWYYHPRESQGGRVGILDCILCFYGYFVVIELKRDLKADGPTPMQKHNMKRIVRAGGFSFEADTLVDVMDFLDHLKGKYERRLAKEKRIQDG